MVWVKKKYFYAKLKLSLESLEQYTIYIYHFCLFKIACDNKR